MALALAFEESGDMGMTRIIHILREAGYGVQRSFDLRSALEATLPDCGCPHHGTAACDCQYAVLLVYAEHGTPTTLVVHGRDGRFWLLFAEPSTYRPNPALQEELLTVLTPLLATSETETHPPDSLEDTFHQHSQPV